MASTDEIATDDEGEVRANNFDELFDTENSDADVHDAHLNNNTMLVEQEIDHNQVLISLIKSVAGRFTLFSD